MPRALAIVVVDVTDGELVQGDQRIRVLRHLPVASLDPCRLWCTGELTAAAPAQLPWSRLHAHAIGRLEAIGERLPGGALVVARVQRVRRDLVGEPLSIVHPGRSLNPVDSLHFDDGPEPVRSSLVARLLQTGTPDQVLPADPANARAAMPVRLTELRSLVEREAQRGCAGSVPGSVHGRLAQAHAALRRDGHSVFAGHADDTAPAECLLRSLYLVQQVERALS